MLRLLTDPTPTKKFSNSFRENSLRHKRFDCRPHLSRVLPPARLSSRVSRDADDDNVIATAVAGHCDGIITGDLDLLVLREFAGVRIATPRQFLDEKELQ